MNVPGEDLDKVRHYYHEPYPYYDQDVLVVGAGNSAVESALASVKAAAATDDNLLYPMKEALRADCTLGEISDSLRSVFGTYTP